MVMSLCPGIGTAVGVDMLPEMVFRARVKAKRKGLSPKTTYLLADALSLPFPDSTFACATAGFSLRNMADLRLALAEMVRVVRPGGRVTTLELTPRQGGLVPGLFRWYYHHLVPVLGKVVARDRSAYEYLPNSIDQFLDADVLAGLLRELGLIDVGYEVLGFGMVAVHWGSVPEIPSAS